MIISDIKKFIFIHIPKTGGMSIRNSLDQYATVGVWQGFTPIGCSKQENKNLSKHAKAKVVKKYTKWDKYFKFAFVRNPWSWLVSGYHYAKKDKRDWRNKEANSMEFKDYLRWSLIESKDIRHKTLRLGQFDFISEHNKLIIDYVGKLENNAIAFNHICKRLGIKAQLHHLNKTSHKAYREYYDTETYELVKNKLRKDIKQFNYTF